MGRLQAKPVGHEPFLWTKPAVPGSRRDCSRRGTNELPRPISPPIPRLCRFHNPAGQATCGDLGHFQGIGVAGAAGGRPTLGLGSDHPVEAVGVPARQIGTAATPARSRDDQQRQVDGKGAGSRRGENIPALIGGHADVGALLQEEQGVTCLPE